MKLVDLISTFNTWDDWKNSYNKWVPKFIEEASVKTNYKDWEQNTFHEFFEQARDQCVSSLQQGYFSNSEKDKIKKEWLRFGPLFKVVADSQNEMKIDVYNSIDKEIRKFTTQHRKASVNRLIASLQPHLLCTIVNEDKLKHLIDLLNKNFDNCSIKKTNNWYTNSNQVLNYFVEELGLPPEEIMTWPWQTYFHFTNKSKSSEQSNDMDDEPTQTNNPYMPNLNTILYGPPGTGKTFHTINKAIEIVDPNYTYHDKTRKEVVSHFSSLIYDEESNPNGQIVFTTFHQSMSYEDFIEGIKPNIVTIEDDEENSESISPNNELEYVVKDGIFKNIAKLAKNKTKSAIDFDTLWKDYLIYLNAFSGEKLFTSVTSELKLEKDELNVSSIKVRFKKSWDPNESEGTRSFIVSKNMIERLFDAKVNGSEENKKGRTDVAKIIGKGRATHIYSVYKDFYGFALNKNAFATNEDLNYVIIIDEINRGNVSAIFGELITLIEPDKRIGEENELSVVLPYTHDKFGVPPNLYIIGTMNTADRSVEALDTALRRRFTFEEMLPKPELLSPSAMLSRLMWQYKDVPWEDKEYKTKETALKELFQISDDNIWLKRKDTWKNDMMNKDQSVLTHLNYLNDASSFNLETLLETINARIEVLVDRDHTIGHSYFMEIQDIQGMKNAFRNKIIPLLQEYFYGDYKKMEMVLGQYFFNQEKKKSKDELFAITDNAYNITTGVYQLRDIYDPSFNIVDAIDVLLKNKKLEDVQPST